METVSASLSIDIFVDCPYCESFINLLDDRDTDGYDHNDDGHVLSQACPDGNWSEKHKHFEVTNVTCTECKRSFNVKGLDW